MRARHVPMHELEPRARACETPGTGAQRRAPLAAVAALTVAVAAVYSPAVFGPPFYTKGEPREAVVVQRIVARGELVLPRRTDKEIPTKPPLFHWLGAAVSALAGDVSEATVRAPSLAASLLTIAATALAGASAFGATAGLTAGAVLATSQQWIASSVTARVDMVLAAAVTAAMLVLLRARLLGARFPDAFWAACAAAVLAKGPVGIALPLLTAATFLALERDLGWFATVRPARAAAALALPLFWYVGAWMIGGDEFLDEIVAENVYRMVNADAGEVGHDRSAGFYVPALLGAFAPWSLLCVPALAAWLRRGDGDGRQPAEHAAAAPRPAADGEQRGGVAGDTGDGPRRRVRVFAIAWAATTIGFYSLADSKRPVYLLSCFPALALLAGDWLARRFACDGVRSAWLTWSARSIAVAVCVAAAPIVLESFGIRTFDALVPVVSPGDAANLAALSSSVQARPRIVLAWLVVCVAVVVALQRAAAHGSSRGAFAAVATLVAATAALVSLTFFRDLARTQSVDTFVRSAVHALPSSTALYYYPGRGEVPELFFARSFEYAATFYARRPLTVIDRMDDVRETGSFAVIVPQPVWDELRAERAALRAAGPSVATERYAYRELARYTYGGNPRRVPVVLVEARPAHDASADETSGARDRRRAGAVAPAGGKAGDGAR